MTTTHLPVAEREFADVGGHGARWLDAVEHHVDDHGDEDEGDGDLDALQSRVVVVRVQREDAQPDVLVAQTLWQQNCVHSSCVCVSFQSGAAFFRAEMSTRCSGNPLPLELNNR